MRSVLVCLLTGLMAVAQSSQLGGTPSRADALGRPSKPACQRPTGATQQEVASHAATTTYGGRKAWVIKKTGTTIVTTHLDAEDLSVTIHTWQVSVHAGPLSHPRPYTQCTYSQNPCSITDWIHVHLGGKNLGTGPYEIAGLGDMHYLSFAGTPARLVLIIIGGDGADAYAAHLIFDSHEVVERILYPGIDPLHPFEVSHYFHGTIN